MFARDDGEITYYEELGVAPEATPQEIRDAFRLFVRLMHPDQQTDPQLREMAEKQMRKLNRIYAVLSDPDSRRAYDEMLNRVRPASLIVNSSRASDFRRLAVKIPWAAAIVVSAAVLIWLAYDATPGTQTRTPDANAVSANYTAPVPMAAPPGKPERHPDSEAAQISQLKSELRTAIVERDAAVHELEKLRGTAENRTAPASTSGESWPVEATPPAAPVIIAELPSAPKSPVISTTPPRIEYAANRRLAGFWFYARPPQGQKNKDASLYIPEYIEATITEDGGTIHGRYRSRFVIADRAISPDVNFTFTGTPNGTQCSCQWAGTGGARGDLVLKLTDENSLRVDWIASEMGSLGLGSGTAVLTRRIE